MDYETINASTFYNQYYPNIQYCEIIKHENMMYRNVPN